MMWVGLESLLHSKVVDFLVLPREGFLIESDFRGTCESRINNHKISVNRVSSNS